MYLKHKWKPHDNTGLDIKVKIRKDLLTGFDNPAVLDCFAGGGRIYQEVYQGMNYLGLDRKKGVDDRVLLCIDNRRYLRSADLSRFNIFDLDAYGSAWEQLYIILGRRRFIPHERVAIFITDGTDFTTRMGDITHRIKPLLGIPKLMTIPCLNRHLLFIQKLLIKTALGRARLVLERGLLGYNPRKSAVYIGLLAGFQGDFPFPSPDPTFPSPEAVPPR